MPPHLPFLHSIWIQNVLSYGYGDQVELGPLNVIIGANASGKSNLISVLNLLAAAPRDLQVPIREGGGVTEWLWKGAKSGNGQIEIHTHEIGGMVYELAFSSKNGRFDVVRERFQSEVRFDGFVYDFDGRQVVLRLDPFEEKLLDGSDVRRDQSVFSQRKDPDLYPDLTEFNQWLEGLRFYRSFDFGRTSPVRAPQRVDLPDDFLLEDASNLGLVLSDLLSRPATKKVMLDRLRRFYERVVDITIKVQGATVQVFFHEEGLKTAVPAIRLSDGTLRYLCLLTILCHPEPPPLICIEEPEIGLHPDVLPDLAELLVEASSRTQLIVTTHSDGLVSALSEVPESILVCERGENGTTLRRLDKDKLAEWLERYRLGDLWRMGEIGGNRW